MDEHDVATVSRPHKGRKSKTGRSSKRKRSPKSRGLRPQRRAACNALSFFTKIGASSEDYVDDSESSLSDSEVNTDSTEAEQSAWYSQPRHGRESNQHDSEDVMQPSHFHETRESCENNRKLVLRIPRRDLKIQFPSAAKHGAIEPELDFEPGGSSACKAEVPTDRGQTMNTVSSVHSTIKWGEVKLRSSKRSKFGDSSAGDMRPSSNTVSQDVDESGRKKSPREYGNDIKQPVEQNVQKSQHGICLDSIHENHDTDIYIEGNLPGIERITNNNNTHVEEVNNRECNQQFHNSSEPTFKLKLVSSRGFPDGTSSSDKSMATAVGSDLNSEYYKVPMQHDEDFTTNQHRSSDFPGPSRNFQECTDKTTGLHDSKRLRFESAKTYGAVYKRTKPSKYRKNLDSDSYGNGDSSFVSNDDGGYQPPDNSPVTTGTGSLRRSSRKSSAYTDDGRVRNAISHVKKSSNEASTSGRRIVTDGREWGSTSKTASLRSTRNRREGCNSPETHLVEKKRQLSLNCWLMLLEHEDIYRYIPQCGDEIMYLRQVMLFSIVFYDPKQL